MLFFVTNMPDFLPRTQPDGATLGPVAPLEAQLQQSPTNTWGQKEEEEVRVCSQKEGGNGDRVAWNE